MVGNFYRYLDDDGVGSYRVHPRTGHHSVDVQVGYFSGFNNQHVHNGTDLDYQVDFGFSHGLMGIYNTSNYEGGANSAWSQHHQVSTRSL